MTLKITLAVFKLSARFRMTGEEEHQVWHRGWL